MGRKAAAAVAVAVDSNFVESESVSVLYNSYLG